MDRVIYCPDESFLDEAQRLSRLHAAPILVGDNDRTRDLVFPREKPIPLSIPVSHYLVMEPETPRTGEMFVVTYVNEFIDFTGDVFFTLFSHIVQEPNGHVVLNPNRIEKHFVEFLITIRAAVQLSIVVWKNQEQYLWLNDFQIVEYTQ